VKLVFATRNRGKVEEMEQLLDGLPFDMVALDDLHLDIEVEEDGRTLEANARKKASEVLHATGLYVLADDSGLEVDALAGAPGVRSARFAGKGATDAENNAKLLEELERAERSRGQVPRRARYRCVLALAFPGVGRGVARIHVEEGMCEGEILREPRGSGGFGYDPFFLVPALGKTMAELSLEEKNRISHRGEAMRKMAERMSLSVSGGGWWSVVNRGRLDE
jgi:XTP/dITP diphosphohydrolase